MYSQTFKGNKIVTTEKLESLLPQRPNKRILKTPLTLGLYFHQLFAQNHPNQKLKWQKELTKLNEDFDRVANSIDNNSLAFLELSKKKESKAQKLTKKINEGNWGMRTFGEAPSYFYEEDARKMLKKLKPFSKIMAFSIML